MTNATGPISLTTFIRMHRTEIDEHIRKRVGSQYPLDDAERKLWVKNDETLYTQAKAQGVKV